MVIPTPTDEYTAPSQCPAGQFAGTVMVWDSESPKLIFLYSRRGEKFKNHQEFYKALWDQGFRFFKFAYRGQMFKLESR